MLTRLLILWLLSEQSLHGYRIARILDEQTLAVWFPTKVGSIYAVLRTLVREGNVQVVAVEREGRRPERTRYTITTQGRRHFEESLRAAWAALPTFVDPIDAALSATGELDEEEVERLLVVRAERLRERLATLDRFERAAPAAEIVERRRLLAEAELAWTETLLLRRREETLQ
jgi:DNA-binding PadR family transcriptional regulator